MKHPSCHVTAHGVRQRETSRAKLKNCAVDLKKGHPNSLSCPSPRPFGGPSPELVFEAMSDVRLKPKSPAEKVDPKQIQSSLLVGECLGLVSNWRAPRIDRDRFREIRGQHGRRFLSRFAFASTTGSAFFQVPPPPRKKNVGLAFGFPSTPNRKPEKTRCSQIPATPRHECRDCFRPASGLNLAADFFSELIRPPRAEDLPHNWPSGMFSRMARSLYLRARSWLALVQNLGAFIGHPPRWASCIVLLFYCWGGEGGPSFSCGSLFVCFFGGGPPILVVLEGKPKGRQPHFGGPPKKDTHPNARSFSPSRKPGPGLVSTIGGTPTCLAETRMRFQTSKSKPRMLGFARCQRLDGKSSAAIAQSAMPAPRQSFC